MATMKDFGIIDAIKLQKKKAKDNKHDIPIALSGGIEQYRKAIGAVRATGLFTIIGTICAALLFYFGYASTLISLVSEGYGINWGYVIGYVIGFSIIFIIPIIFGYKLRKLESTPNFILVSLIVAGLFNALFFVGVLPIVGLVLDIIALTRWSTYKDWFYRINVKKK